MRYPYLLLLPLLGSGCGDSGAPPKPDNACALWESGLMIGTAQSDELLDVLIDEQGNVYLAGYENGQTGTTNIEPSGSAKGFVLKYNRNGQLKEKLTLDSTGASTVEALALDAQTGELFLAGRTNGAIDGYSNAGQYDLLLGWMQRDTWQPHLVQFGDERPQHPRRIALGLSGEIVIAGYDDIFVPTNYVEAWENPLLAKYSRNGMSFSESWDLPFDTPQVDTFSGLTVSASGDGSLYVTGHDESLNERGIFVARYDSQGTALWRQRITTIAYDNGAALHTLSNGNLLLAGSSFALLGEQAYGQMDVVVIELDAVSGGPLWTAQYGSSETDWVTDMAVDDTGQIYVIGETLGSIEAGQDNPDANALFLLKLDAGGELLLARQWNSSGSDQPLAVAVDACERAFIAGYTSGNLTGQNHGGRDGFILPIATAP